MKLLGVGWNWKTPIRLREQLAFDAGLSVEALRHLRGRWPAAEFVLLSTCNRTELYAGQDINGELTVEQLCQFLADVRQLNLADFYEHVYLHEDADATLHLFKVTSGLDSLVLGEAQILGQVKEAYQRAVDQQAVGRRLHLVFQRALAVAKRIHTETQLSQGRLSIASAAVDYIKGVFDSFGDKQVLVIGAGKMAELTLKHLQELAPRRVLLCNRSRERAEALAQKVGGAVRGWDELRSALTEADIVVSSTGADEPILRVADLTEIMKQRKNRWLAIVDIAVPRDFEPAIARLENVCLWNIDDLEKVRFQTLRSREKEYDRALRIAEEESAALKAVVAVQQTGPIIGQLEQWYQQITVQELDWLFGQLNGVSDEQREKIKHFAHRLKNKFLHPPKSALREQAKVGEHHSLLHALRQLFGLGES